MDLIVSVFEILFTLVSDYVFFFTKLKIMFSFHSWPTQRFRIMKHDHSQTSIQKI